MATIGSRWQRPRKAYQKFSKEAIIIVLDVGKSMHNNQSSSSVLEEAKKCLCTIVRRKIFLDSHDEIALILFGTCLSPEEKKEGCTNVSIVQEFLRAEWDFIDYINKIKQTSISTDSIRAEALLIAINFLREALKNRIYTSSKILFISNFNRFIGIGKVDKICRRLKDYNIGLTVIGPKAFTAEDFKLALHRTMPRNICTILREVSGESYSFNDACHALAGDKIKVKYTNSCLNAYLELGVLEKSKISIPILAFKKTFERKHNKYWEKAYADNPKARIRYRNTYLVNDVTVFSSDQSSLISNYQEQICQKDVISAYRFGTSLIPFSHADKINMHFDPGEKGIKILGFTKNVNIPQYLYAEETTVYVFARKNDSYSPGIQLAAFIQALHATGMMAICRLVYTPRSCPKIGYLAPKITENYECLIFIALPFKEDIQHLEFPSLDSKSENIPTDEQLNAVDELIDAMDLTKSESGEEMLKPKKTPNPYIQRLLQCLDFREMYPKIPLPKTAPHIEAIINPSPELLNRAKNSIKRIKTLFQTGTSGTGQYTRFFKQELQESFIDEPDGDPVPEENFVPSDDSVREENFASDDDSVPEKKFVPNDDSVPKENFASDDDSVPEEKFIPNADSVPEENVMSDNDSVPEENFDPNDDSVPEENFASDDDSVPEEKFVPSNDSVPEENFVSDDQFVPNADSVLEENFVSDNDSVPEEKFIPDDDSDPEEEFAPDDDFVPEEEFGPDTDLLDANIDQITEKCQKWLHALNPSIGQSTRVLNVVKVGSINPVRDFQYMVSNSILPFDDICDQLMNVIFKYLKKGVECAQLRKYYSKILSICKDFRHTSLKIGESDKYNFFMKNLKNLLLECEEDLWDEIKREQISLISNQELPSSTVSFLQAESFLERSSESENEDEILVEECFEIELDDYDMMLDQL